MTDDIQTKPFIVLDPDACKFPAGQIVSTRGALAAMQECQVLPASLLRRHLSGDWGSVPVEDAQFNEMALKSGGRLLSSYSIAVGVRIWIISEADRSSTTILLPSEY